MSTSFPPISGGGAVYGTISADRITMGSFDYAAVEERVLARMLPHGLTPAEHERLAMLGEEAAEIAQMVGKIMRFGYDSYHPNDPATDNRAHLIAEIFDLLAVVCMMKNDLSKRFEDIAVPESVRRKKLRFTRYQP